MFVGCHCYQRQVFAVVLTLQMILTSPLGKIQQVGAPKQLWKTHAPCFYIRLVITRVMNMQLWQCFSRAKLFRLKKARFCLAFFDFQKNPKAFKNARISKSGFKKAKLATLQRCSFTTLTLITAQRRTSAQRCSSPLSPPCRTLTACVAILAVLLLDLAVFFWLLAGNFSI